MKGGKEDGKERGRKEKRDRERKLVEGNEVLVVHLNSKASG
jgi:hypothetical protein